MNVFNRITALILWLVLLILAIYLAVFSLQAVGQIQAGLNGVAEWLTTQQAQASTNFLIAQIAFGIVSVLLLGLLVWLEIRPARPKGVRIRTSEGSAELDPASISRRLEWHLDQLAEVVSVVPSVKSRGGSVDILLEVETAPDIDLAVRQETVGIEVGTAFTGQPALPVRRHEPKAVPAPAVPAGPDLGALQDDVVHLRVTEEMADTETGLPGSDDHDSGLVPRHVQPTSSTPETCRAARPSPARARAPRSAA